MPQARDPDFLPEELVVDLAPRFSPRVGEPYVRRLNYVPGRSLTADALNLELRYWDTQHIYLGRALNPGILEGLELELMDASAGSAVIRVTAGRGVTDLGASLELPRSLTARLEDIPASEPLLESSPDPVGVVGLFLKPVRAQSANRFDPEDPCPVDPGEYAYQDLVAQDAVELVWARLDFGDPVARPPEGEIARPVRPIDGRPEDRAVLGLLSSTNVLLPAEALLDQPEPFALPTSLYRGIMASRLLKEEAAAKRRGERAPWAIHGLPIGVLQVAEDGAILCVDRFAIARAGGAVREAQLGSRIGAPAALRRARFDQFLDHIQALRAEGAELSPATNFFRELPPVGILPAAQLDRETLTCRFFPHNYAVEAAPIQMAQMESILARRAGLAPFDLARRDYVQLLVPVPDHLFHPRLLIQEEISPAFQEAVAQAALRETQHRSEMRELSAVEAHVTAAIDASSAKGQSNLSPPEESAASSFRSRSRDALEDLAQSFGAVPLTKEEEDRIAPAAFDAAVSQILSGLKPKNTFTGLKPFVENLAKHIDSSNDHADLGFLRLQSDIFRLRKQMAGEADATRLAISPVLANLATTTTSLESSKIFSSIVKSPPEPATQLKLTAAAQANAPQVTVLAMTSGPSIDRGEIGGFVGNFNNSANLIKDTGASRFAVSFATENLVTGFGKTLSPLERVKPRIEAEKPPRIIDTGLAGIKVDLKDSIIKAKDIAWQSLIYGKGSPVRTTTVAERLRPSPAQEAKNSAVATKAEIVRGLQELGLNLDGLSLPVSASRATLIPQEAHSEMIQQLQSAGTVAKRSAAAIFKDDKAMPAERGLVVLSDKHLLRVAKLEHPAIGDGNAPRDARRIHAEVETAAAALYDKRISLSHPALASQILADKLDPDPEDADEAAYFAAAVDALESAVAMLRLFEGRVQSYAAFLDLARKALVQAIELAEAWRDAVNDVEAEIDEAVHDANVAKALMTEEQARLDTINAERRDILDKHVDIIAFARPMTADRLRPAPAIKLFSELAEILPACLENDDDVPEEIEEILDAMGDAPVGWYPELARELPKIRRPNHYLKAWQRSLDRAHLWLSREADRETRFTYSGRQARLAGKASTGVHRAILGLSAQRRSLLQVRTARTMASLNGVSWSGLRRAARDELSIDDLIEGGKAGRDAARKGARMLRQIGAVANCFLAGLREVPGEIRLTWADQLSEHDQAIDLSNSIAIPAWAAIPFEQRRALDHLHVWLFARIDTENDQARGMMSTLVRVCLLMASHAPVSSIVEGAVVETKNVGPGERFEVDIGLGRPQIGMIATIGTGLRLSRGVIEDIVGMRARVKLTEVKGPRIALTASEKIKFSAPIAIRLADIGPD